MADTMISMQQHHQIHQQNLSSLLNALDPISLLLSSSSMERGPRYEAYAELRESKLRNKYLQISPEEEEQDEHLNYKQPPKPSTTPTPMKKQVKFHVPTPSPTPVINNNIGGTRRNNKLQASSSCSVVAQSVPDFGAVLRREKEKENRRPPPSSTRLEMMTPPWPKSKYGGGGDVSNSRGSKSASAGEKNRMARKSYASLEELKGLSSIANSAINGGGGRAVGRATAAKAVLGYRHF